MSDIPIGDLPRTADDPITAYMFVGISVYGLLAGTGFIMMGLRGRQYWMAFWGGGLVICSILYLASRFIP